MGLRTIVEERQKNIVVMDVSSKLIQERIIFIDEEIDDELASGVIAQMLYLDSISKDPISIYINSPGGSVYAGLAILDVATLIKSPIRTIVMGLAGSMGAVLTLIGQERCATKNATIMIHQPSMGSIGTVSDVEISLEEGKRLKKKIYEIMASRLSKTPEEIEKDCDRDYFMDAETALKYGIINKIL